MTDARQVLKAFIRDVAHVGFVVPDLAQAVANARRVYGLAAEDISYQPDPAEEGQADQCLFHSDLFSFFGISGGPSVTSPS